VLDGGPCRVGIESTVLDLSREVPAILRPGEITRQQIESVIGRVELFRGHVEASEAAASPGQQRVHYAPRSPAYRFDAEAFAGLLSRIDATRQIAFILLTFDVDLSLPAGSKLSLRQIGPDPKQAARDLYGALREVDERGPEAIYVEMPPEQPEWLALRDRITRATMPWTE
jgi:L-threonylcarbamoyladenylate synthase